MHACYKNHRHGSFSLISALTGSEAPSRSTHIIGVCVVGSEKALSLPLPPAAKSLEAFRLNARLLTHAVFVAPAVYVSLDRLSRFLLNSSACILAVRSTGIAYVSA